MKYINKNTGDIIEFSIYHRLSPEAKENYIALNQPKPKIKHKAKVLTIKEVETNRSSAYKYLDL